ncbi:MAG: isochorismate synthase [Deltaproteobacteria bacterium]|nr:isochorismate synthase [Deltaproteobacteria bacterium]
MLASPQFKNTEELPSLAKASNKIIEQLDLLMQTQQRKSLGGEGIKRIEAYTSMQDPLLWLHSQKADKKTFWRGRDGEENIAGIGETLVFESDHGNSSELMLQRLRRLLSSSSEGVRIFGGMRFNLSSGSVSEEWHSWKHSRFIIPEIELISTKEGTRLACNVNLAELGDTRRMQELKKLLSGLTEARSTDSSGSTFHYLNKSQNPGYEKWCDNVNQALSEIHSGSLQKIVLARKAEYQMQMAYDPLQILLNLRDRAPHAYQFCFQIDIDHAWLGISPERLYRRQLRKIETEAVASTRPRGLGPGEDKKLAMELLQSQKEVREHELVLERIENLLSQLCDKTTRQSYREILKLRHVQHLQSRVEGHLHPEHGEAALLTAIHPTPAVCGIPDEEARSRIEQLEKFDRGWYAGPVGWFSKNGAEFAVAIRSALMDHQTLRIFTGAGIVQGSNPDSEWEEINAKLRNWESILEPV